jgi:hypothetical protein
MHRRSKTELDPIEALRLDDLGRHAVARKSATPDQM